MKMIEGAVSLAVVNRSRTRLGAHADEHLDELGAVDREEGDAGLAGHGAAQERFSGARRAHQQNALGNAGAEALEFLRDF